MCGPRFPFYAQRTAEDLLPLIRDERVAYVLISDREVDLLVAGLERAGSDCVVVRLRDERDRRGSAKRWKATMRSLRWSAFKRMVAGC